MCFNYCKFTLVDVAERHVAEFPHNITLENVKKNDVILYLTFLCIVKMWSSVIYLMLELYFIIKDQYNFIIL